MTTKPVDEVLEALRLQSTVFSRMTLAGDWGFAKDALLGAPFHLVLDGRACLRMDDGRVAHLRSGDVAILPRGEPHRLLSHVDALPVPWRKVAARMGLHAWTPGTRFKTVDFRYGEGEPVTTLISGVFAIDDHRRNPLLAALSSVMLVRAGEDTVAARAVAAIAAMLDAELLSGMPGAESVAGRLADILFVQVVRHHLSRSEDLPRGWLRGLADRELGPALALIHRGPERAWTVATLAKEAGMSRSRFAARFQAVVGQAPLEYLTQWRMHQAARQLATGRVALSKLAASVGYRSVVAFSKAFKRWAGMSPDGYRRAHETSGTSAPAPAE